MVESLESTYYKTTIVVLNFGINLTQPLCYFLFTQFPSLGQQLRKMQIFCPDYLKCI